MKVFVIADTHFGHDKLIEKGTRPADFEDKIINSWKKLVTDEDLVIHLGDAVWSEGKHWSKIEDLPGRIILLRGNHDKRSNSWYLTRGIAFVCERFDWDLFGLKIAFTHEPLASGDFDVNVHGHLHDGEHRGRVPENRNVLISLENDGYGPILLTTVVKKWQKSLIKSEEAQTSL